MILVTIMMITIKESAGNNLCEFSWSMFKSRALKDYRLLNLPEFEFIKTTEFIHMNDKIVFPSMMK